MVSAGAVFFYLAEKYNIQEAYISDTNLDLISLTKTVKNNVGELIHCLQTLSENYYKKDEKQREDYFYEIRNLFKH